MASTLHHVIPPRKTRARTLSRRLGYGPHERLLIVHADDLGLARAVNTAFFRGLATGLINSGSAMVPCPWFSEVASFAQAHPEADIGLHLTLTSEHTKERWAPVASRAQVPSLVDQEGNLLERWTSETRINPYEVEIELRAQIDKAFTAGLRPTHLDSRQHRLQQSGRELFDLYVRLGREYHLPVRVSKGWFSRFPYLRLSLTRDDVVLDWSCAIHRNVPPERWSNFYRRALKEMPPGVTEFIIHPAYDNEELQRFFEYRLEWGAAWRQRDFDFFTSDEFRGLLAGYDIKLITWREIATQLRRESLFAKARRMVGSASGQRTPNRKRKRPGFEPLRTISGGSDGSYVIGAMFTATYSDKAERLAASCEKFGLQYAIHEVPTVHRSISNRGTEDLSYTKAGLILHLLGVHRKPVLYLDVDCEVVDRPELVDELARSRCDFAIYNTLADEYTDRFFPTEISLRPGEPPIRGRFYRSSGFMNFYSNSQLVCCGLVQFYRNSLPARELLSRWQKTIEIFRGCADDQCLDFVFNNLTRRSWLSWMLKVQWLPKPYARISWWIYAKPVINHPDHAGAGNDFREIIDPKGRKRFYPSQAQPTTAALFPRDCIIDTEQHMVCRLVDSQLVPVEPTDQGFWP